MITVEKLLGNKAASIWSIGPDVTVFEAIEMMRDKNVGALVVLLEDKLIGILSERDYTRKIILEGLSSRETPVKKIMTRNVFYTFPAQNVEDCMVVMTKHHIRHLPVIEDEKVVGMISLGDVVKAIIQQQKIQIEHLENTISWGESY